MSYQVLARKWRPAKFAQLVGQDHVKSALINGLDNQRLHHAYLFTGTRGVGKTSIARIFAKSLNCETGISAEPCGRCQTCLDVDAGRFVDLIEIDAASRTKVQDTREILDNVQYAPSRGRYKIYLIDEVHMLSRHSFNALLKTLEEPPEHVKFLLATTDPQKLPVTILSRCLQFNLQALAPDQITEQLSFILQQETIQFEQQAVELLAKYARGSMRDALSLTDQAIAQSGENLQVQVVRNMLGTVDTSWPQNILAAIMQQQGETLVEHLRTIERQHPDVSRLLDDLITLCHQVALTQVLPSAAKLEPENQEFIKQVAEKVSPEAIQVYYQLLLQGKKELSFAPDLMTGLEMTCLRLLAFSPAQEFQQVEPESPESGNIKKNSIELTVPPVNSANDSALNEQNKVGVEKHKFAQPVITATENPSEESSLSAGAKKESELTFDVVTEQPKIVESFEAKPQIAETSKPSTFADSIPAEPEIEQVALNAEQNTEQNSEQNNSDESLPPLDSYDHLMMEDNEQDNAQDNDQDLEALFNQQNFVQQIANDQGFQAGSNNTEQATETTLVDEPKVEEFVEDNPANTSTSVDENPVLAILASRGLSTDGNDRKKAEANKENNDNPSHAPAEEIVNEAEAGADDTSEASITPESERQKQKPQELMPIEHEEVRYAHQVDQWAQMIEGSELAGLGRQLALNSEVVIADSSISLTVKQEFAHLLNERSEADLRQIVSKLAPESEFLIHRTEATQMSPSDIQKNINVNRQERAEQSIEQDPFVQQMVNEFGGQVVKGSIIAR